MKVVEFKFISAGRFVFTSFEDKSAPLIFLEDSK